MQHLTLNDLSSEDRKLVEAARNAADNAYAPYSGFAVGAAVRVKSGVIIRGANMENASYGLTLCAEAIALGAASSEGQLADVEAIAISGFHFLPPVDQTQSVTPCGRCRQLISESAQLGHRDTDVLICSGDLKTIERWTISELLPQAFGPAVLHQINPTGPKAMRENRRSGSKVASV